MATQTSTGPTIPTALYSKDKNLDVGQLETDLVFGDTTNSNIVTIGKDGSITATGAVSGIGTIGSIDTATTPASGSCEVQFTLNDAAGDALAAIQAGLGYLSDDAGVLVAAGTSVATATNGSISTLITGQVFMWVSKADGTLGVTLTAPAASYYISLVLPNGKILVSDEIVVNA